MRVEWFLLLLCTVSAHLMESLHEVPEGWRKVAKPFAEERLLLRIAMHSPKQGLFEQTLYQISDPSNDWYGKHLKREELKHMLRPSSEATESVFNWLLQSGVSRDAIADDGEWINFVVSVESANKLLDADFVVYESRRGDRKIRTLEYSAPEELYNYIDMIQPTTRFGEVRQEGSQVLDIQVLGQAPHHYSGQPHRVNGAPAQDCKYNVTPVCLRSLYKLPAPEMIDIDNVTSDFMAFANFLDQIPRYADLREFQQDYDPYALGANFSWESIAGGDNQQSSTEDSGEANLDLQYLQAVGWPVNMHSYNTAGRGPLVPDPSQPDLTGPDEALPHTLAVSYGEAEQSVPEQFRRTVCNMFGQLGARGMSVIFASGDIGVGSSCQTNDGRNRTRFLPMFPAACPYLTSVGAVSGVNPESAVSFSSGGFSDTRERPSYQESAVTNYLQRLGNKWQGLYNTTGRGFPDVAAKGFRFHVIDRGTDTFISDTSASAPVFGGVIALINAERLKAGKSPLGFLNPFIYSSGYKGLNDITNGGSQGCRGRDQYTQLPTPYVPRASWSAVKGWDPVTEYRSPSYKKLLPLAINCP